MVNNYAITVVETEQGWVRITMEDWGQRMIGDGQGTVDLYQQGVQAPTLVEAMSLMRDVLTQREAVKRNAVSICA